MASVDVGKPKTWTRRTNRTTVAWVPDYARLRTSDANMGLVASWLAHNVALCVPAAVKVTYNGAPGRAPWDFFGKTFFEVRVSTRRRCSGAILEPSVPGAHLAPVPGVCSTTCSCYCLRCRTLDARTFSCRTGWTR